MTIFTNQDQAPMPAPSLDFDRLMLLGVFLGDEGRSGCSNLTYLIRQTKISNGVLRVAVGKMVSPRDPCAMIVYPLDVMIVPKFNGQVDFYGFVPG
jgi:hypothetical protein